MSTRFIIVRHGQSIGNAKRVLLGHTNWDLSEFGYLQAEATARALSSRRIDAVYSSDLLRAYNTVLPCARARGIEVIPDECLREQFIGEWEGKSVQEITKAYGELFTHSWVHEFGTFRAPSGESIPELGERIERALLRIGAENPDRTVLIGCHAAAIRALFGRIKGIAPEELAGALPFPDNASYSEVDYEDGKLTPVSFSNSEHLRDMMTPIPF